MSTKANLYMSTGIVVLLILTIGFGGYIMYTILAQSQENSEQIATTAAKLNNSYDQIIEAQQDANIRGNLTIEYFEQLFQKLITNEDNIIGNLSDHRRIANESRDTTIDLLEQLLNKTR